MVDFSLKEENEVKEEIFPETLLDFGDLFKRSWKIYWSNWSTYLGILLCPSFFVLILIFLFVFYPGADFFFDLFSTWLGISILILTALGWIFLSLWVETAIICAVFGWKEKISITKSFGKALRYVFDYFLIIFLTLLIVGIGFIFFILPGIIFGIYLSLAPLVLIGENIRGFSALKRSWNLVSGHWGGVFVRFLVLILCLIFLPIFLSILSLLFKIILFPLKFFYPPAYTVLGIVLDVISNYLIIFFTIPYYRIYSYLIFKNLKRIKEK